MDFGVWQAMVSNPDSCFLPCDSGKLLSYKGKALTWCLAQWGWINEKHHLDP